MSVLKIRDENGQFIGVTAIKGEKGDQGVKGDKGEDGAIHYTAGTNIEITADNVINCTASGTAENIDWEDVQNKPTNVSDFENDANYITTETVETMIKDGGIVEWTDITNKPTETDPTVPSHVKNITQANITDWNNKSEFSGSYNDLTNKPTIPNKTSDLTNDSNYTTNAYVKELTQQEMITCISNADITKTTTVSGDVTLVESAKRGTKLSVSGGKVVIPNGINQVLVSASMVFKNNTANALVVQPSILKYSGSEEPISVITSRSQLPANGTVILSTTLKLIDVTSGDELSLHWWKSTTDNVTVSGTDNTCLTVIGLKG